MMLNKKIFITVLLAACVLTAVFAGGQQESSMTDNYTMRIAHVVQEDHPSHVALIDFKNKVESRSEGKIKVELIPNGALGGEAQLVEMVSMDAIESVAVGEAAVSTVITEWALVGVPYMFSSLDAARNSLDSEFGDALNELSLKKNIRVLGWGEAGFRNITNSRQEITSLSDMKGLKIRVMENPIHIALFNALGANPTPMSFTEVFTGLQQGTIDAQENPVTVTTTSKFYEVQDYMSFSEHVYTAAPLLISENYYQALPEDLRGIIDTAASEWVTEQRALILKNEEKYLTILEENGMKLTRLTQQQKKEFMDAAQTIYPDIIKKYGDNGEELMKLARSKND